MKKSIHTLLALAFLTGACLNLRAADAPAPKPATPAATTPPAAKADEVIKIKPYALDFCVVSGDKLDSMPKNVVIIYNGQEVKFCCSDCPPDFAKDPAKYMKMIADGQAKLVASAPKDQKEPAPKPYPLDYSVISGDKLSTVAKPIVVIYNQQEIKFAHASELDAFYKDPLAVLKKITDAQNKPTKQP
jgi:YHS domain-containing protein